MDAVSTLFQRVGKYFSSTHEDIIDLLQSVNPEDKDLGKKIIQRLIEYRFNKCYIENTSQDIETKPCNIINDNVGASITNQIEILFFNNLSEGKGPSDEALIKFATSFSDEGEIPTSLKNLLCGLDENGNTLSESISIQIREAIEELTQNNTNILKFLDKNGVLENKWFCRDLRDDSIDNNLINQYLEDFFARHTKHADDDLTLEDFQNVVRVTSRLYGEMLNDKGKNFGNWKKTHELLENLMIMADKVIELSSNNEEYYFGLMYQIKKLIKIIKSNHLPRIADPIVTLSSFELQVKRRPPVATPIELHKKDYGSITIKPSVLTTSTPKTQAQIFGNKMYEESESLWRLDEQHNSGTESTTSNISMPKQLTSSPIESTNFVWHEKSHGDSANIDQAYVPNLPVTSNISKVNTSNSSVSNTSARNHHSISLTSDFNAIPHSIPFVYNPANNDKELVNNLQQISTETYLEPITNYAISVPNDFWWLFKTDLFVIRSAKYPDYYEFITNTEAELRKRVEQVNIGDYMVYCKEDENLYELELNTTILKKLLSFMSCDFKPEKFRVASNSLEYKLHAESLKHIRQMILIINLDSVQNKFLYEQAPLTRNPVMCETSGLTISTNSTQFDSQKVQIEKDSAARVKSSIHNAGTVIANPSIDVEIKLPTNLLWLFNEKFLKISSKNYSDFIRRIKNALEKTLEQVNEGNSTVVYNVNEEVESVELNSDILIELNEFMSEQLDSSKFNFEHNSGEHELFIKSIVYIKDMISIIEKRQSENCIIS